MKVFGIDPGSRFIGVSVLVKENSEKINCLECDQIVVPQNLNFSQKLYFINEKIMSYFVRHRPEVTVVEKVFLGKNVDSAFKLGHARGVCLSLAARYDSLVVEYSPKMVKKQITGNGSSSKEEVRSILTQLLSLPSDLALDTSDSLALGYSFLLKQSIESKLKQLVIG